MNKVFPKWKPEKYHHFIRVLAFIAEQKVANAKQIEKYCFCNLSRSLGWDTLKKLREARFIEVITILDSTARSHFTFHLTEIGFKELKSQSLIDLKEIQIKSNTPKHDIILTDLRLFFSHLNECKLFISENIIRSKILEDDLKDISVFRSNRCDSAVLMNVNNQNVWLALEYERSQKSQARYVQRIKNWYQAETLPGILLVAENDSLIEMLSKIDAVTNPHLPRKILFISKERLYSSMNEVKFFNSKKESLTFILSNSLKIQYPILDQNLAKI